MINKPVGITSYDVIRDLKKKYPGEKIGHAGTLDPLAEGLLICLVGREACKRQSEFMGKDKVYEFEFFLGVSTDTYDILGLPLKSGPLGSKIVSPLDIEEILVKFDGVVSQKVPPFSAVKIRGKPLYRWYLSGQIDQVEIPTNEIEIFNIELLNNDILSKQDLQNKVNSILETIKSGFRNEIVREAWNQFFKDTKQQGFVVLKMRAHVSKGTYIRAIVDKIGEYLGTYATCLNIKRTKIGSVELGDI